MDLIARWIVWQGPKGRHVEGPSFPWMKRTRVVLESDYEDLATQHQGAVDLCRTLLHAIPHDHSAAMPGNPSGRCSRCKWAAEFDRLGGSSKSA